MTVYRVFNGKIYIILDGFDYPHRAQMFAFSRVEYNKKKKRTEYILNFPPGGISSGHSVTHLACDSGDSCQGQGEDTIFSGTFLK